MADDETVAEQLDVDRRHIAEAVAEGMTVDD
jgi:hypothetical protein